MTTFDTRPDEGFAPPPPGSTTAAADLLSSRIDERRFEWPDVERLPDRTARAAIARRLFRRAVGPLPLRVELAGQPTVWGSGGPGDPVLRLVRPDAVFDRLGDSGLVGFGEAYLAGDLDAGDAGDAGDALVRALTVLADNVDGLVPGWIARLRRLGIRTQPDHEANTPDGSRRNISRHYDLSNGLFASFLDPTMTYSAALFDDALGTAPGVAAWAELEAAQHRKIDRLLDAAGVGPDTSLLEIGTGWGELARRAATRGATVRSITLSEEQRDLARDRIDRAGLGGRVDIDLCDYRDVDGSYDAVISVEMIEAVGAAYWPTYAAAVERVLAPGGTVALQAITMPHRQMQATVDNYTWIHKYVFPGGMIPSVEAIRTSFEPTGLGVVDDLSFGLHYAETLRLWRRRYAAAEAPEDRFDDPVFRRMWTFYLAYSEAGFRARYLDVRQLTLRRPT